MKIKVILLVTMLCTSVGFSATLYAQEKPKADEKADTRKEMTPLRVQVTLTEYDGEKKISSLPYTLLVIATDPSQRQPTARIRMGLRVPIATGGSANNFQYQAVGTNLDCSAWKEQDGRFNLHLNVERSAVYSPGSGQKLGNEVSSGNPVIEQLSTESDMLIRDGQTAQTTIATDPVSGRVTKLDVTVNAMK